jgi:CRP-like cAMP-binding protein
MSYDILLIDDNAELSENITAILELAHYNVRYASDGKKGVEMATERCPDLVICDVMMPNLDGFGVLHILRKNPATAGIPFIFLTARNDKADFRAGMNSGADDYITKPFDAMDLLNVVEVRLKRAQMLRSGDENGDVTNFNENKEAREFQSLWENRPVRSVWKKENVFLEGQTPGDLFYIVEGQIKTLKFNSDGKELITGLYRKGQFFGYAALLEDTAYKENAEALEDSKVAVIPRADFLNLMYSSREIARRFVRMISNDLSELETRLLDVAYQSVRQRAASILLQLDNRRSKSSDDLITLARKDMSSIVGTAPESFNRTLADFKDEGLIDISASGVRILNKGKLEKIMR